MRAFKKSKFLSSSHENPVFLEIKNNTYKKDTDRNLLAVVSFCKYFVKEEVDH